LTIKALNEYDPKLTGDWKKKVDSQRTALLATELKTNAFRLTKIVAQAILAETNTIKLGFISRASSPRD